MKIVLIGNKNDKEQQRTVLYEEAQQFALSKQILFFETSAKQNINISKAFAITARQTVQRIVEGEINKDFCSVEYFYTDHKNNYEIYKKYKKCCLCF
ncbi:Rab2a [Hexamita inflata]|uniref:Rab2a n=1 Tax=Hexamita inflata TaxID=28002 RepID=A0ABP1MBH5_9EUKA